MPNDFRIPRLYKTLLAVAAVVGPMVWLLFTEDGQRRTDIALMWLLGRPSFDAALDAFSERVTEARLRETFPALDLACSDRPAPFGNRVCTAPIGSFNGWPARAVSLYFEDGGTVAVKVIYQPAYHGRIRDWVERRAHEAAAGPGEPRPDAVPATDVPPREPVGDGPPPLAAGAGAQVWAVPGGALLMRRGALAEGDEPALFWLGRRVLDAQAARDG